MSDDTADNPQGTLQHPLVEKLEQVGLALQLAEELRRIERVIALQDARIAELELDVRHLRRVPIPTAEALRTFDQLHQAHPDLTLADFARTYDLSYDALRKYRARRRPKTGDATDT